MKNIALDITIGALCLFAPSLLTAQQAPSRTPSPQPTSDAPKSPSDDGGASELHRLLAGYHGLPDKKIFENNLTDPATSVRNLAMDTTAGDILRKRAVSALSYWPTDETFRVLENLLDNEKTPTVIAFRALSVTAKHYPQRSLSLLEPYLHSTDRQARLAAIEALRKIPHPKATRMLEKRLERESDPVVRKALQSATTFTR